MNKVIPMIALLYFMCYQLFGQNVLSYEQETGILSIPYIKPPGKPTVNGKDPQWRYMVEFGNGNYASGAIPRKFKDTIKTYPNYSKTGTYEVKLYLTPHYSNEFPPDPISTKIEVEQLAPPNAEFVNRSASSTVSLTTNVGHEAIRKHPIRVIATHRNQNTFPTDGYLIFLYNHLDDVKKLKVDPFAYLEDSEGSYYTLNNGKKAIEPVDISPFQLIDQISKGKYQEELRKTIQDYRGRKVFKSYELGSGEQRNLFFTIVGDESLEAKKSLDKEYLTEAIWLPEAPSARSEYIESSRYNYRVVPGHDPNTNVLSPNPAFYSTGRQQRFINTITFKNHGKGTVKDVTVKLEVSPDLDVDSVRIISSACKPSFEVAIDTFYSDMEARECIKKSVSAARDSLFITFYNINLKRGEKATLVYTIPAKEGRPRNTYTKGIISFLGAEDKRLRRAKVAWKKRGRSLNFGLNFGHQLEGFHNRHGLDCFAENFVFSLNLENRPLDRGWNFGYGLAAGRYQFERLIPSGISCDNSMFSLAESFQFFNVDLLANVSYQLNRWIRVQGSAGLALPIYGKVQFSRTYRSSTYIGEHSFGWIDRQVEDPEACLALHMADLELRRASPGLATGLSLEVGHQHIATGGLRYLSHYYPNLYSSNSAHITNWQLFIRFNLPTYREIQGVQ